MMTMASTTNAEDTLMKSQQVGVVAPTVGPSEVSSSIPRLLDQRLRFDEVVGMRRFVQNISIPSTLAQDTRIFHHDFTLHNDLFTADLWKLYRTRRFRIRYTFIVTSVVQHIGLFYSWYWPMTPTIVDKYVIFNYNAEGGGGVITPTLSMIPQLLQHQVHSFGDSFAFHIETSWNLPMSHYTRSLYNTADIMSGEQVMFGRGGITTLTPVNFVTTIPLPTINVWAEIIFEELGVPQVLEAVIPP